MKNPITRAAWIAFGIALFMAALLFYHRLDTGGDNLDFILLARSLLWHHWSDILGWPRPAGYSATIALVLYIIGVKLPITLFYIPPFAIYALKIVNVLIFGLTASVVCRWVNSLSKNITIAVAVSLLFGVNQILASTTSIIGAEPLFMLLVYTALFQWEKRAPAISTVFVIIGMASLVVKYQGFALAAAVVAWVVWHRKLNRGHVTVALLFAVLMCTLASCQWLGNRFILEHVTASDPYGYGVHVTWADRISVWVSTYAFSWPALLAPKVIGSYGLLEMAHAQILTWPVAITIILLSLAGFVATLRRLGLTLSHLFFLAFIGILIVWPDYLLRYLVPLLPLGLWFFVEGIFAFSRALEKIRPDFPIVGNSTRAAALVVALLACWSVSTNLFAGVKNWRNIVRLRHETPWAPERYRIAREEDFADYMEAALWSGQNLPVGSVIFCRKALFVELASGRKAEYYSGFASSDALWSSITNRAASHPTYILRDAFSPDSTYGKVREMQLMPVLREHTGELEHIHATDYGSEILRVVKSPE